MKEQLLNAAISLYKEKGYENVSIDMIASACNVSKGCFYHYYDTKGSILVDYYEIKTKNSLLNILTDLVTMTDPVEQLWKIWKFFIDCNLSLDHALNAHLLRENMNHNGKLYPVIAQNIIDLYPEIASVIQKVTEQGQAEKRIKTTSSWDKLMELYCCMYHGLLMEWCCHPTEIELETKAREYYQMIYLPEQ